MVKISAEVYPGCDELRLMLAEIAEATDESSCAEALKEGSEIIVDEAQARAPRDTGNLASSGIGYKVSGGRMSAIGWTAATAITNQGRPDTYGRLQEMGTSRMAANPYLRPAFFATENEVLNALAKRLKLK